MAVLSTTTTQYYLFSYPLAEIAKNDDFNRRLFVSDVEINNARGKSMRNQIPGSSGAMGIVCGIIGVGLLMSVMFGDWGHWIPLGLAILVSLGAIRSTRK